MHVKINRIVAFVIEYCGTTKSKSCCHPPFHPLNLCRNSLKIFVTHPPKISELDTVVTITPCPQTLTIPQNLEHALGMEVPWDDMHQPHSLLLFFVTMPTTVIHQLQL